jgi:serine/threonine protein kinase
MAVLFKYNIVHRDLKPENILYKDGQYKIADFGYAKYFPAVYASSHEFNTIVGTPSYMSPQVLSQ